MIVFGERRPQRQANHSAPGMTQLGHPCIESGNNPKELIESSTRTAPFPAGHALSGRSDLLKQAAYAK